MESYNIGIISLLINVFLYMITFFLAIYFRKQLVATILFVYLFTAILSFFLFIRQLEEWEITILPFIYQYVIIIVLLLPLFKFKSENILIDKRDLYSPVFYIIFLCAVITFIRSLSNLELNLGGTFNDLYIDASYSDQKSEARTASISIISLISVIGGSFSYLSLFFLFFLLSIRHRDIKEKGLIVFFILLIIFSFFSSAKIATRGNLVILLLDFVILRMIFKKDLKSGKLIKFLFLIVFCFVISTFFLITISRFSSKINSKSDVGYSLINYGGQGFLNFNSEVFYNNDYTYGDATASLGRFLLGKKYAVNQKSYESNWGITQEVFSFAKFSTMIGAFCIDYGRYITFILAILVSFCFYCFFDYKKVRLDSLLILFLYSEVLITGFYLFRYMFFFSNIRLCFILIFIFCTRLRIRFYNKKYENSCYN